MLTTNCVVCWNRPGTQARLNATDLHCTLCNAIAATLYHPHDDPRAPPRQDTGAGSVSHGGAFDNHAQPAWSVSGRPRPSSAYRGSSNSHGASQTTSSSRTTSSRHHVEIDQHDVFAYRGRFSTQSSRSRSNTTASEPPRAVTLYSSSRSSTAAPEPLQSVI